MSRSPPTRNSSAIRSSAVSSHSNSRWGQRGTVGPEKVGGPRAPSPSPSVSPHAGHVSHARPLGQLCPWGNKHTHPHALQPHGQEWGWDPPWSPGRAGAQGRRVLQPHPHRGEPRCGHVTLGQDTGTASPAAACPTAPPAPVPTQASQPPKPRQQPHGPVAQLAPHPYTPAQPCSPASPTAGSPL